ncbi:MAG: DUF5686 family protein [Bacteroidota bacterium]
MKHRLTFILSYVLISNLVHGQAKLKGQVTDTKTNEPLVFVAVVIKDTYSGTTTDIDGKYELSVDEGEQLISFRFVGYQTLDITVADLIKNPNVKLKVETKVLDDVTILAGENPAHPIIRQLVANKKKLNPSNMDRYSFESYNKFQIGTDIIPEINEEDSVEVEMRDFVKDNYMFSMESVTQRNYKKPGKITETILGNKVSGLRSPQFTTVASSFQNIGFFYDYISIMSIDFLNPISKNSFDNYYFDLTDSINDVRNRKIYIVTFEPRKSTFNGLKGVLHIDAEDMALESVSAETSGFTELHQLILRGESQFEPKNRTAYDTETYLTVNFKLQQHYEPKDKGVWFPNQLKLEIFFGEFVRKGSPSFPIMGIGKSYIKNINLTPDFEVEKFGRTIITYDPLANKRDDDFWRKYRDEQLTSKEVETYQLIDSVFQKNKVEKVLAVTSGLVEKKISLGKIDLNLNRAFDINRYEGFRAGMGLSTSSKFSRWFEMGGYWAYGFRDKADKFGGYLNLHILKNNRLDFFASYSEDIKQFGKIDFYQYKQVPLETERYYNFLIDNMNSVTTTEFGYRFYWLRFLDTQLSLKQERVNTNTDYRFSSDRDDPLGRNAFDFTEVSLKMGYNHGVNYVEALGNLIRTPRSNLYIGANYTRGLSDLWDGEFDYNKFEFMIQKKILTRSFGQPTISLEAGYVDEVIPAAQLFNIRGTGSIDFDVFRTFRTMGINEFVADKYVNVFYQHKLTQFTINSKYSKPQIYLVGAMAYGEMDGSEAHLNDTFTPLNDYYFESGLLIRRIFRFAGLSIGGGVFNRMGDYAFSKTADNLFFKVDLGFDTGE